MVSVLKALLGSRATFNLTVEGAAGLSRVVRFSGTEGISSLFEYHLEVAGPDLQLSVVVGKPACLSIGSVDTPRYVHGLISHIEYTGNSSNHTLYELTLVPPLWRLLHRHDCRIFQNVTTKDVLEKVFKEAGIDKKSVRFDLAASYSQRNYCVQYRESDFNFVSRLMEEDGIFYYYEHSKEQGTLVIADHPGAYQPIPGKPLLWFNADGLVREQEYVTEMRVAELMRPGSFSTRDFNFHTPDEDLQVNAEADRDTDLEVYDYPGEYQTRGFGKSLAQIRLESLQVPRRTCDGDCDSPRMTPGHTFTLTGHRRTELNTEYMLTRVVHHGSQLQVLEEDGEGAFHYSCDFACIEKKTPYRPPRVTPRPVVRGLQSATVVGAGSEEIHVDEQGRVIVQFHWDRQGKNDENSSCWVRASQLWAGRGWGAMFIPRVGHEVLVDFIEGDPDRPIITGRVYHAHNDIPYPLPDEKTKSTIKSDTSPDSGGFNELRFEDRKDAEQIFLHAQRNIDTCVLHDSMESVLHDKHVNVGTDDGEKIGDFTEQVYRDRHITVHRNQEQHIGGDVKLRIGGIDGDGNADIVIEAVKKELIKKDAHLHVTASRSEHVDNTYFLHVGNLHVLVDGNLHIKGPKLVVEATNTLSLQGGGSHVHLDGSGISIEGPKVWLNCGKSTVSGDMDESTPVADAIDATPNAPTPAEGST